MVGSKIMLNPDGKSRDKERHIEDAAEEYGADSKQHWSLRLKLMVKNGPEFTHNPKD